MLPPQSPFEQCFGTGRLPLLPLLPWNVADPELSCDKHDAVSDLGCTKKVSEIIHMPGLFTFLRGTIKLLGENGLQVLHSLSLLG